MLTRDERQNLGIQKWMASGFRGTWVWATGVGIIKKMNLDFKTSI